MWNNIGLPQHFNDINIVNILTYYVKETIHVYHAHWLSVPHIIIYQCYLLFMFNELQ